MKQLVLDLRPDATPTLENFVVGANAELLATLARLAAATAGQAPLPHLYLWGGAGSGRSHLLRAACERRVGIPRASAKSLADGARTPAQNARLAAA